MTFTQAYNLSKPANFMPVICFVGHAVYKVSLNQRMHWSYA